MTKRNMQNQWQIDSLREELKIAQLFIVNQGLYKEYLEFEKEQSKGGIDNE